MKKCADGIQYWEQQVGRRASKQILRYQCVTGDSAFIVTGKKPVCPECKGRKLTPIIEVEQLGLFSSKFDLVMRCNNEECSAQICFSYEIAYQTESE